MILFPYNYKGFCCFPKGIGGHDLETQVITVFSNFINISFGVFVVLQWWLMIA